MRLSEAAEISKRYRQLVEVAAESMYDQWYNVTPETSQNAYIFEKSEDLKEEWRGVARTALRAIEGVK